MPYGIPYEFLLEELLSGRKKGREGEIVSPLDPYFGSAVKDWAMSKVYPEMYGGPEEQFRQSEPPAERAPAQAEITAREEEQRVKPQPVDEAEKRAKLQRETNLSSLQSLEEMPSDKLMRIRAQAKAKGRAGSLGANVQPTVEDFLSVARGDGGGGSFFQAANTPELQARLKERDAWEADQPMRDLEFAMTPEQARRNPDYAKSAAESLAGLKEQQAIDRKQKIQELFVNKLAGSGGTIPRDQAAQLQAMGVEVPYSAIGASADEGLEYFDSAIRSAGEGLQQIDPLMAGPDHPRVKFERYGAMRANEYKRMIQQGMNPDDAMRAFKQEMAEFAMAFGLLNVQQGQMPEQQAPQGQ